MAQTISLTTGQLPAVAPTLRAGDRVLLSGVIWTGRDAAHKRLVAALDAGEPLLSLAAVFCRSINRREAQTLGRLGGKIILALTEPIL